MFKKMFICFISLCLVASQGVFGSFVVVAGDDGKTVVSGALSEEIGAYTSLQQERLRVLSLDTLSTEQKEKALSKLAFMSLSKEERTALVMSQKNTSARYFVVNICNVPFFRQEKNYYCGPAVTKQTIHYLSDGTISPSQAELAIALNTDLWGGSSSDDMAEWIETQGYYYYKVDVGTMDVQDIINYVATGIGAYDYPPFGAIAINRTQMTNMDWYYTTNGHFINISAIRQASESNDASQLQITDPYITWVRPDIDDGKYWVAIGHYNAVKTSFWW